MRRLKSDALTVAKREIDDLLHYLGDDDEKLKSSPKLARIMERLQKETGKAASFRGMRYFAGSNKDGVRRKGRGVELRED